MTRGVALPWIRRRRAAIAPVALAAVLLASVAAGAFAGAGSAASVHVLHASSPRSSLSPVPAPSASPAPGSSLASVGAVERTIFLNYNASIPGNFPSAVWDWEAGTGVTLASADQVWIPEWPHVEDGIPLPASAPALLYDPVSNETTLVPTLTNTSALAVDPINGNLYATEPLANAVVEFDPVTEAVVGAPIPVGSEPMDIAYDPDSQDLFVANEGSNNVTVINGTTNSIVSGGISVGHGPVALSDDPNDGRLFVANSASDLVSVISTSLDSAEVPIATTSPSDALSFSAETDNLAVARPTSSFLTVYVGSTGATVGFASVGDGVTAVTTTLDGSEFVTANDSGASLSLVYAVNATVLSAHPTVGPGPSRLFQDPIRGVGVFSWSAEQRTISVVNLTLNAAQSISPDLGARAAQTADDPNAGLVFVTDWLSDSVTTLNASTLLTARQPLQLPGTPNSIIDDPATGIVYVGYDGGVLAFVASSGAIVAGDASLPGNNSQMVVDPESDLLWLVNNVSGLIALRLPSLTPDSVVGLDSGKLNLEGVTLDPLTNELFVVDLENDTIVVLNGTTGSEIGPAIGGIPDALSVAFDPADNAVYVLGSSVWILDPTTHAIEGGPIEYAPHAIAWSIVYDPSRQDLYIPSNSSQDPWTGNVSVLDGSSIAASEAGYAAIPVGQLPIEVEPVPVSGASAPGSAEIWVSNFISGTVSVIASPPSIASFAATPDPVDVGATSQFGLAFTGGAVSTQIQYTGLPPGCASADTDALNCTPDAAGNYTVSVQVSDGLGFSTNASTILRVSSGLGGGVSFPAAVDGQIDWPTALTASASAIGGDGPYNYTWSFGDGTTGWGTDVAHNYAAPGDYTVSVVARDSAGGAAVNVSAIEVNPAPAVTVLASPGNATDVGVPISLSADIFGGSPPGAGTWSFGDGTNGTGFSVTHTYARTGVYFASFAYRDSFGDNASNFVRLVVAPALSASISVNPGASVVSGTVLWFNTTVSGGTAPYTIVWGFDDGSYAYGSSATHSFANAGTYTVTLFVEDGAGASWNSTYRVTVAPFGSASELGGPFDSGLLLGVLVGAAVAAIVLFAATRSRGPPGAPIAPSRPSPPAAPLPEPDPAWRES